MESTTKVVLVTGASSGNGEAVALRLAAEGHDVVAGARRRERLAALAERHDNIRVRRLDVTDRGDVAAFVDSAVAEFGRVDVLVNNAITPGVVESELADTISDPVAREAMREYRKNSISPDAVARAISFAVDQPADVDVNEIIIRPTRQRG
ncbi:SDR family oxidoreductase [Polymorphospora rubra]|uniref:SDR family oxidoreductase n=1 Tax=Polymorphospora rubra TaxID=338584 RepID=UPI0033F62EB5